MALEDPRRRELAELVPYHIFSHENLMEHLPVVHQERETDELGNDRTSSRPGLYRLTGTGSRQLVDLDEQLLIDVWSFFERSCHSDLLNLQTAIITRPPVRTFYVLI